MLVQHTQTYTKIPPIDAHRCECKKERDRAERSERELTRRNYDKRCVRVLFCTTSTTDRTRITGANNLARFVSSVAVAVRNIIAQSQAQNNLNNNQYMKCK